MEQMTIAASGGMAAGLPPLPVALVGFLGNALTLLPVVYAGDEEMP
jgi:Ca2+/H+ antiporter, TMEM165/GDT1 family